METPTMLMRSAAEGFLGFPEFAISNLLTDMFNPLVPVIDRIGGSSHLVSCNSIYRGEISPQ